MIGKQIKRFCSTPEQIENYEKAINDDSQVWCCHHRLELDENGNNQYSRDDLKARGLYYNRPPEEFIFLTKREHRLLHLNEETRAKIGEIQIKSWTPKRRRKHREYAENKRKSGMTATGIEQLRSDEDYRNYQREMQRQYRENNPEIMEYYKQYWQKKRDERKQNNINKLSAAFEEQGIKWVMAGHKFILTEEGKLFNISDGTEYKGGYTYKGYRNIIIQGKRKYIHTLVAEAFIPNPNNLKGVEHLDGNPHNNNVKNLRWSEKRSYIKKEN